MAEFGKNTVSDMAGRKNRLVLVVDSDANNLFYTSMLLQRFNYHIKMAATAGEALQMAEAAVPALVITALRLKDMSGMDLMQKLKQNLRTAAVLVITLTRQGDLLGEKRSLELGAVDCLRLPVSPEELYRGAVQAAVEPTPRSRIRVRALLPVKVENMPFEDLEDVYTLELSERGIFLRTTMPAALNTRLSLRIELNHTTIPVEAVVLYSYRTAGGPHQEPGMGLGFVQIAPQDQELIRQFIRSEITRGIEPLND